MPTKCNWLFIIGIFIFIAALAYFDAQSLKKGGETMEKKAVVDHPVEDSLGNEITSGDTYITDQAGNVIRFDLEVLEDYLLEVHNVNFFEAK